MSKVLDYANEMTIYQPIPFDGFDNMKSNRTDCAARYDVIKANYGSFKGKTMYDLCSANCYFGFRFLHDGGKGVIAVEGDNNTRRFVNAMAEDKGLPIICQPYLEPLIVGTPQIDIGLYLDTHYADNTKGFIEHMKTLARVVFTSSCKDNDDYEALLKTLFPNVQKIYQGFADRKIFKCW